MRVRVGKRRTCSWLLLLPVLVIVSMIVVAWLDRPVSVGEVERYIVKDGDTLWSIARERYPGSHTGQKVGEIRELNGISPALRVGQEILLEVE